MGIATGANNYTILITHPAISASMITGLATVATSGSYNDLVKCLQVYLQKRW